jgi:glycosyltransferase involved in cell wall biosynthesis
MKIVLFDWTTTGHHQRYIARFSEVLANKHDVIAAIPEEMIETVNNLPIKMFSLGKARPSINFNMPIAAQNRVLAFAELDHFENVVRKLKPDHIIHLYADPIIRRLVERQPLNVPTTLCIFFPRAHYPSVYKTPLPPKEILRAWFLEYLIARWRRRPYSHSLFTLDEEAFRRWSKMYGAPVFWLPEPYVRSLHDIPSNNERSGCVVYGALDTRKGIHLLARAISLEPVLIKVVLAGSVEPGFENELMRCVREMEKAGANVDLRAYHHNELEGLGILAKARCAVLSYPRHYTMSRVLIEACSVGTPVVVHDKGLLGHLVRQHGLGIAVDCTDPKALRHALITLSNDQNSQKNYCDALARFAAKYSKETFEKAIAAPFYSKNKPG